MKKQKNLDLFVAYVSDITGRTKELRDFMSHNWFSLKKGRTKSIEHYFGKDKTQYVKVYTAGSSVATIWDNDFLLFCITQLRRKMEQGDDVRNGRLVFTAYDYYTFRYKQLRDLRHKKVGTYEKTLNVASGQRYKDLWSSLERLHETHVKTNIQANGITYTHSFVWLSEIKKIEENGKSVGIEVQVADWLVNRVTEEKQLLTFDDTYFELKGGLERWLFLFCRKACGVQREWRESLDSLYRKSASTAEFRKFKAEVKKIAAKGHLLDYELSVEGERRDEEMLVIRRANTYLLDADKKSKAASEAIKKSKEILSGKDDEDSMVLENEEMWRMRVIDESRTEK